MVVFGEATRQPAAVGGDDLDKDLAYEILWNFVRILSSRLRETNDKMTFLSVTGKF